MFHKTGSIVFFAMEHLGVVDEEELDHVCSERETALDRPLHQWEREIIHHHLRNESLKAVSREERLHIPGFDKVICFSFGSHLLDLLIVKEIKAVRNRFDVLKRRPDFDDMILPARKVARTAAERKATSRSGRTPEQVDKERADSSVRVVTHRAGGLAESRKRDVRAGKRKYQGSSVYSGDALRNSEILEGSFIVECLRQKRDTGKRQNVLARNASWPDNPRSAARRAAQDLVLKNKAMYCIRIDLMNPSEK